MKWLWMLCLVCGSVLAATTEIRTPTIVDGVLGVGGPTAGAGQGYVLSPVTQDLTLGQRPRTSDVAPGEVYLQGSHAYGTTTASYTTGGDIYLAAGMGRRFYTVVQAADLGGSTVTVTVNGAATVKTEPGDWAKVDGDNNTTATNIATAISSISGVTAAAVGAVVYVRPTYTTHSLSIAKSALDADITATQDADGGVYFVGRSGTALMSIRYPSGLTTPMLDGYTVLRFGVSGTNYLSLSTSSITPATAGGYDVGTTVAGMRGVYIGTTSTHGYGYGFQTSISENTTIAVGSGFDPVVASTAQIPAKSLIVGCVCRVTDAPGGGATTLTINRTGGTTGELISAIACTTLGNTGEMWANAVVGTTGPLRNASAVTWTLTTDADVTVNQMTVRVTVFYVVYSPPGS